MSSDLICVKFGGWSLQNSEFTEKSIDLILQEPDRKVVVVSGPKGLTNLYIQSAKERILNGSVNEETYRKIDDRWEELCAGLDIKDSLDKIRRSQGIILNSYDGPGDLESLKSKRFIDNVARLGEAYEAGYIFAARLNKRGRKAVFLEPEGYIYGSDSPGDSSILPDPDKRLKSKITELIDDCVVVLPGFYCYTKNGDVVTLPRGGSDTTGSHVASELDARIYENFTNDVVRRADPDVVNGALALKVLTYNEALELAYMGFGIFKDEAVVPCKEKLIPIHVVDTLHPERRTIILSERQPDEYDIAGVAYKKGFGSVNIRKVLRARQAHSSLTEMLLHTELGVGEEGEFPVEQIMTSVSNVSFLIPGEKFTNETTHRLKRYLLEYFNLHENDISIRYNISLVTIVGQYMKDREGINCRAAGALAASGISTSHLIQGGSEISILYGMQETTPDSTKARHGVERIYNEFFAKPVFGKFLEEQRMKLENAVK